MVEIHPYGPDVVPRCCLMTEITLGYFCMFLAGDPLRYHFEVAHGVTGRRAMTLCAVRRTGRWVPELSNRPLLRSVADSTLASELPQMAVTGFVAAEAVQPLFIRHAVCGC